MKRLVVVAVTLALLLPIFFLAGCAGAGSSGPFAEWQFTPKSPGPEPSVRIQRVWYEKPYSGYVSGKVFAERPQDYVVWVEIKVSGTWWPKPYYTEHTFVPDKNGMIKTQLITGGEDQTFDSVRLTLFSKDDHPVFPNPLTPLDEDTVSKPEGFPYDPFANH